MKIHSKSIKKLLELYKEINIISEINALVGWDLNVNMPPKASSTRAQQSAYLTKLSTDKWNNPQLSKLIKSAIKEAKTLEEKAIVRNIKKAAEYYQKVPKELIVEFSKITTEAFTAWHKAKQNNNFSEFSPFLKEIIKLNQLIAKHLGFKDNPYDALLDLYEPELTAKECKRYFSQLQPELTELIKKISKSKKYLDALPYVGNHCYYPPSDQEQLSRFVLRKIGYDFAGGNLAVSPHPFTVGIGHGDTRVTTMYTESDFRDALMSSIHEGGHALYEQGINPEYIGTPLDGGVSLGIHESQSRFWENMVGRHPEFIKYILPTLQTLYSKQLGNATLGELVLLFNHVKPGFIRIEADEVTYTLHIILRFELENDLINGKLDVNDLPDAWHRKMKKYLGITPPTDTQGVLQDVHWSYGSFGYFPTYSLGNLYAAQFRNSMLKQIDLEKILVTGELGTILGWLRENIHQHGSLYYPKDLVKKITGKPLSVTPYLNYIKQKYSQIYQL